MVPIFNNGVYSIGYFNITTGGVITVGIADAGAPALTPFTASANKTGIPDCVMMYTLF
jgi:hypothetical protein